jgi:MFS family permease
VAEIPRCVAAGGGRILDRVPYPAGVSAAEISETPPQRLKAWEALRHRDFRLFWIGALVSNTGSWMQRVTVPYVLFELTGSATWIGVATFAQFVPAVFLGPLGGSLADRFPRRRLLLLVNAAMVVPSVLLWVLWVTDHASPVLVTLTVTLLGIAFALVGPTWQAFVSELVPRSALLNAVTLNSTQFNASRATGPMFAGLLITTLGPGSVFLVNAASFGAVIAVLMMIRSGNTAASVGSSRPRPLREFRAAVRYATGFPGIVACLVTVAALGLCGGPLTDLVVVFAKDVFEVDDLAYGLLVAGFGVGAVIGAPFVAGRGSGVRRERLLAIAVWAFGGAVIAFALAPVYAVALVALLVVGAGYLTVASTLNTTIQVQVADAMRGKVLSVYLMVLTITMPLGALVQGWLTDLIGPRPTVTGAGVLFLVVVMLGVFGTGLAAHLDDGPALERTADADADADDGAGETSRGVTTPRRTSRWRRPDPDVPRGAPGPPRTPAGDGTSDTPAPAASGPRPAG